MHRPKSAECHCCLTRIMWVKAKEPAVCFLLPQADELPAIHY